LPVGYRLRFANPDGAGARPISGAKAKSERQGGV
jgi:hypothetical protein